jgi:glycine hydroxymethyltransferase
MTTRGFKESEFAEIVYIIDKAIRIAAEIQSSLSKDANRLKDWKVAIGDGSKYADLMQMKKKVSEIASVYPLPALMV